MEAALQRYEMDLASKDLDRAKMRADMHDHIDMLKTDDAIKKVSKKNKALQNRYELEH